MDLKQICADLEKRLEGRPYSLTASEKKDLYEDYMETLTKWHRAHCPEYDRMLKVLGDGHAMLPVSLFKKHALASVPEDQIYTIMQSSGTTGQTPSSVVLDAQTAMLQQRVLLSIGTDFLGRQRLPMLIIDSRQTLKNRQAFSARAAGIMGFSIFASARCYALDEEMHLDLEGIRAFLEKYKDKNILVFGFTFMVWQQLYAKLKERGETLPLENGILIHGGGWKKLADQSVTDDLFRQGLLETCHLERIHNYYGMAEQTGSIYMECEAHHLHASDFSDITFRNMKDLSECGIGVCGLAEVRTPLALSYPGHDLLTEDQGMVLGIDDCPCGRKGKYFKLTGRMKRAEVRGCSDVYTD